MPTSGARLVQTTKLLIHCLCQITVALTHKELKRHGQCWFIGLISWIVVTFSLNYSNKWKYIQTRASGEEATYARGPVVLNEVNMERIAYLYGTSKGFFMYKETIKSMVFREWNIKCNWTQYHFTVPNIPELDRSYHRWCTHMKWLLNNNVGIIKKVKQLPRHWFNDHCWQYINDFQSLPQSHVYIRNDRHQINQCGYEFENANYDARHTYGINWKWNNWYDFQFYFNYHLVHFQLKTNSVGITEVSVVPMANNMYFIQWITISYYPNGYELNRNDSVCIKIAGI